MAGERKEQIFFGIDFSKVPPMDVKTANRIIEETRAELRKNNVSKQQELPRLSPEAARTVIR